MQKLKAAFVAAFAFLAAQAGKLVTPATSDSKTLSGHDLGRAAVLALLSWASTHVADILGIIPGLGSIPPIVAAVTAAISMLRDYYNGPPALPPLKFATFADIHDVEATKAHNAEVGYFARVKGEPSAEDVVAHYQAVDADLARRSGRAEAVDAAK